MKEKFLFLLFYEFKKSSDHMKTTQSYAFPPKTKKKAKKKVILFT